MKRKSIVFTLVADGPSDRILMHVIRWALHECSVRVEKQQWADPHIVGRNGSDVQSKLKVAMEVYPANIFFIHRDAESESYGDRVREIDASVPELVECYVPVVPVRMTEAWFLHDVDAIRDASGNPNGKCALRLPPCAKVESCRDPKKVLFEALLDATELRGRRREKKDRPKELSRMRARVAELIKSYDSLRGVPSFDEFLKNLDSALKRL